MQERARSYKRVFGTNLTNIQSSLSHSSLPKKDKVKKSSIPSRQESSFTVYDYLKSKDTNKRDDQQFLETNISKQMRKILVEWLVNVHHRFKLGQQTLFHCILHLDRVLFSRYPVKVEELQLLGITSLWMASKYEQVYSPPLKHFIEVTDNAYCKKDFLKMEETILKLIDFNLTQPTRYQMMINELQIMQILPRGLVYDMCLYLCELSIIEVWNHREQDITKGCVYLASRIFKKSGKNGYTNSIDSSQTTKNIAYRLINLLGNNTISAKYDCDAHQYVGGYTICKKQSSV